MKTIKIDINDSAVDKNFFQSIVKSDIISGNFEIVNPINHISEPFSIDIIASKSQLHGVSLKLYAVKGDNRIALEIKDTLFNRLSMYKIVAENIKSQYVEEKTNYIRSLLTNKIIEKEENTKIIAVSDNYFNSADLVFGDWRIFIPKELISIKDIAYLLDIEKRYLFDMVELEKKIIKDKINNLGEYIDEINNDKLRVQSRMMDDLEKYGIILSLDRDIFEMSEIEISKKLVELYNFIIDHGGRYSSFKKETIDIGNEKFSYPSIGKSLKDYQEFITILSLDRGTIAYFEGNTEFEKTISGFISEGGIEVLELRISKKTDVDLIEDDSVITEINSKNVDTEDTAFIVKTGNSYSLYTEQADIFDLLHIILSDFSPDIKDEIPTTHIKCVINFSNESEI